MVDYSSLASAVELWSSWGFEPWQHGEMAGVYRRVTVRKGSLLGDVARYYADDYVVWRHRGEADRAAVADSWRPVRDVMTQRFVFVDEAADGERKCRSFWLGLRGFLEVYGYRIGGGGDKRIRDLTHLIDAAWNGRQTGPGRA